MKDRKKIAEYVLMALILAAGLLIIRGFFVQEYDYQRFETSTVTYEKAVVTAVVKEELEQYESDADYMVGYQKLQVQVTEGEEKGAELEVENYITLTHNVIASKGSHIILCADRPDNAEPYYTVYNYDRGAGIWIVLFGFLALVILIGKRQGIRSCVGLFFTMTMVVGYLLPELYHGKSAVFASILTVGVSSAVTCFCIGGLERKTLYNIISATLGGMSAGAVYLVVARILRVAGCSMEDAESLVLVAKSTGMKLNGVLFAGILVAALGAVMDVAVSLGAALQEIKTLNPQMQSRELFASGMHIGKDMIGTMTNTLILAFVGGSLSTLIIFISYGVQYNQLLSSNFLALEMLQGIAGSAAVILTVPISAAVCALGYGRKKV